MAFLKNPPTILKKFPLFNRRKTDVGNWNFGPKWWYEKGPPDMAEYGSKWQKLDDLSGVLPPTSPLTHRKPVFANSSSCVVKERQKKGRWSYR
jgi:hypothetical protein